MEITHFLRNIRSAFTVIRKSCILNNYGVFAFGKDFCTIAECVKAKRSVIGDNIVSKIILFALGLIRNGCGNPRIRFLYGIGTVLD